jgi:exopolysaccharide biosynthesis polyprenyl glycosylphosphotransferase
VSRPVRASERRLALLLGDAAAVTAAVLLALWTWSITAGFPFDLPFLRERGLWLLTVPAWVAALIPTRQAASALDLRETGLGVLRAAATMLVVYLAVYFSAGGDRLPRLVAVYLYWNATLLVLWWRLVAVWFFTRTPFVRRVVLLGEGQSLLAAVRLLQHASFRDVQIIGVVGSNDVAAGDLTHLGRTEDIELIARQFDATDLIVALDDRAGPIDDQWTQRLLRCQESGVHVSRVTQLYEGTLHRVLIAHVGSSWLLTNFFDVARFRDVSPLAKRLFDVTVAAALGAAGLLIAPAIVLAIAIESGLPILYQQQRLGRGGRPFQLTKFRTMRPDAESDGGPQWSPVNDHRITRVGRFLRQTRLDELPNLIAVMRGEMSMVGPRPERPEFVERLEGEVPLYRARLLVAPGLTGWAQVNWAYGDSVGDAAAKLEFDLYYVKHQSMAFDVLILLRTIGTMLRFGGR